MADWPEIAELKQLLNIVEEHWDGDDDGSRLTRVLATAIARVKSDVGYWDDDPIPQEPTDAQAQAALRMAELIATRPTIGIRTLAADPTYRTLLTGQRRVFGFA